MQGKRLRCSGSAFFRSRWQLTGEMHKHVGKAWRHVGVPWTGSLVSASLLFHALAYNSIHVYWHDIDVPNVNHLYGIKKRVFRLGIIIFILVWCVEQKTIIKLSNTIQIRELLKLFMNTNIFLSISFRSRNASLYLIIKMQEGARPQIQPFNLFIL